VIDESDLHVRSEVLGIGFTHAGSTNDKTNDVLDLLQMIEKQALCFFSR